MAESEAAVCNLALGEIGSTEELIASLTDTSKPAQLCALYYPHVRDVALKSYRWPFASRRAYPAQLGGSTWAAATTYAIGAYVSYAPNLTLVAAGPETLTTFVYVSLGPQSSVANLNKAPDSSPTFWRQISRAEWAYCFQLPTDIIEVRGLYHANLRNPREDQKIPHDLAYEPAPGPGAILLTDACLVGESPPGTLTAPLPIALDYTARVTDTSQFPEDFTAAIALALASKLALSIKKDPVLAKGMLDAYKVALSDAKVSAMKSVRRDQPPLPAHLAARF